MFIFLAGKKTNQKKPAKGNGLLALPLGTPTLPAGSGVFCRSPSVIGQKPVTLPHSTAALPRFAGARLAAVKQSLLLEEKVPSECEADEVAALPV